MRLLDWSGRSFRAGKQVRLPAELPDILDRLNVSAEGWLSLVSDFSRLFRRAAAHRAASRKKPSTATEPGSTESATPRKSSAKRPDRSLHPVHIDDCLTAVKKWGWHRFFCAVVPDRKCRIVIARFAITRTWIADSLRRRLI